MIAERVVGQFAQQAMILMPVTLKMRKNHVRRVVCSNRLEFLFYVCKLSREIAIPKGLQL